MRSGYTAGIAEADGAALWAPHAARWGDWTMVGWGQQVLDPLDSNGVPVVPVPGASALFPRGYLIPDFVAECVRSRPVDRPDEAARYLGYYLGAVPPDFARTLYALGGPDAVWRVAYVRD